jgi:4-amino-4-deoxy-L-arabinose transferase-like glycosyltransferase
MKKLLKHSKNKETIILSFILLLAAFLRLYKISDYMTFLGDEGRDVLVARGILMGHFTLLGPRASAGDFYLGPIYYYFMAPFLWLFRFDPVGPAVMVALFSLATVFLVYFVGRKFFNKKTGLFAAAFYAVSPLVITYSHSSWNPNVLPFFSLLFISMIYQSIVVRHSHKYFFIAGILLGISLQLHYLALFLGVIALLYIFFAEWMKNKKIIVFTLFKHYLEMFTGFLLGFSPFLAFEIRHGFPNTKTIIGFIFGDTLQKEYETHASFLSTITSVFFRVFGRLVFNFLPPENVNQRPSFVLWFWICIIMIIVSASIINLFRKKNKYVTLLLSLWLFLGVFLFGFYKKQIYDYYFAFLFPLPFLLIGNFISELFDKKSRPFWGAIVGSILFFSIFFYNLYFLPFKQIPNRQKDQTKQIAQFIISQTGDRPFNFALLSPGNSDDAYRYYLEILNHKPVTIENSSNDPQRKSVTNQLLIVCEDIHCKPLGNALWQVAGFGRAEIVKDWDVSVVKVYKLVHYTRHN